MQSQYCQNLTSIAVCSEFRKAFTQAADRTQANASFDCFDNCGKPPALLLPPLTLLPSPSCLSSSLPPCPVFEMQMEDRGKFFDALTALCTVC